MEKRTPNELNAPLSKFCLALEEYRRTNDGRVRTSQELLQHFFPHDQNKSTDRIFRYLPNEVRGPILTTWGTWARPSRSVDSVPITTWPEKPPSRTRPRTERQLRKR